MLFRPFLPFWTRGRGMFERLSRCLLLAIARTPILSDYHQLRDTAVAAQASNTKIHSPAQVHKWYRQVYLVGSTRIDLVSASLHYSWQGPHSTHRARPPSSSLLLTETSPTADRVRRKIGYNNPLTDQSQQLDTLKLLTPEAMN